MNQVSKPTSLIAAEAKQVMASFERPEQALVADEGVNPIRSTPTAAGESNPVTVFLMRYHGTSLTTHKRRLRQIAGHLGAPGSNPHYIEWSLMTEIRLLAFLNELAKPYNKPIKKKDADGTLIETVEKVKRSPSTLNGYLDTIRGVLRQAFKLSIITPLQWEGIQDIKPIKNQRPLAGRMVQASETNAFEKYLNELALHRPVKAARDRAIFRLAFLAGIRRHEFCKIELEDFEPNGTPGFLRVNGKGDKIVVLEINEQVSEAIRLWIEHRGTDAGPLFYRINRRGDLIKVGISQSGIGFLFSDYCERLGLSKLTCHDGRRTYCSNILDLPGIDPTTAMGLLRHSSFNTTAKYDRRDGRTRRAAVNQLTMKEPDYD
ncbi:tyrosine-type recombinase/integrase [Neptuniibacter halophilus]|uniref:tyrosine-type recombinase/integrase n=1 Tax=Neptuniibacter halophilus TaxID=651666 RepID=UPI00257344C2|nr:site-specific integrase [Neptuniibacter halophilus]